MNKRNQQVKFIFMLLPKIARNLRIAPLIDTVKSGLTTILSKSTFAAN